jgi:NADPH-dependent curcumin reductase
MDVAGNLRADDSARRRYALGRAGPRNYTKLIVRRGRMEGFLVTDYAARFGEAIAELARWSAEGKVRDRVDVVDGLENAPEAFRRLFTGDNLGKQLVRIAEPS